MATNKASILVCFLTRLSIDYVVLRIELAISVEHLLVRETNLLAPFVVEVISDPPGKLHASLDMVAGESRNLDSSIRSQSQIVLDCCANS